MLFRSPNKVCVGVDVGDESAGDMRGVMKYTTPNFGRKQIAREAAQVQRPDTLSSTIVSRSLTLVLWVPSMSFSYLCQHYSKEVRVSLDGTCIIFFCDNEAFSFILGGQSVHTQFYLEEVFLALFSIPYTCHDIFFYALLHPLTISVGFVLGLDIVQVPHPSLRWAVRTIFMR